MDSNTYANKMVEKCADMILQALSNLTIEDIDMYRVGYDKGVQELEDVLCERFSHYDIRDDWTNADIRETIHFEVEQLKKGKGE